MPSNILFIRRVCLTSETLLYGKGLACSITVSRCLQVHCEENPRRNEPGITSPLTHWAIMLSILQGHNEYLLSNSKIFWPFFNRTAHTVIDLVTTARGGQPRKCNSMPVRGKKPSFFSKPPEWLWDPASFLFGTRNYLNRWSHLLNKELYHAMQRQVHCALRQILNVGMPLRILQHLSI